MKCRHRHVSRQVCLDGLGVFNQLKGHPRTENRGIVPELVGDFLEFNSKEVRA